MPLHYPYQHLGDRWYDPIVDHAPGLIAAGVQSGAAAAGRWALNSLSGSRKRNRSGDPPSRRVRRRLNFDSGHSSKMKIKTSSDRFTKKFKKGGKPKTKQLNEKYGCVFKNEGRGTYTSKEMVNAGHSVAPSSLFLCVCCALWRKLYEKTGFTLSDWRALPQIAGSNFTIVMLYQKDGVQGVVTSVATGNPGSGDADEILAGDTHFDIGQKIRALILDNVAVGDETFILKELRINPLSSTAWLNIRSELSCNYLHITVGYQSVMNLQNRTSGDNSSDQLSIDVTQNPLYGRQYDLAGHGVHVAAFMEASLLAGENGLMPNAEWGVIGKVGAFPGSRTLLAGSKDLKRTQSTSNVILQSGQIATSKIFYSKKMGVNWFFRKFHRFICEGTSATTDSNQLPVYYGETKFYQFKKKMQCQADVNTQDMIVGYQINNKFFCRVHKERRTPVMANHFDDVNAVNFP